VLGSLKLPKGMHASLHDIDYDVFAAIKNHYPRLARSVGIPEFRVKVARLAAYAGRGDRPMEPSELEAQITPLHKEAVAILGEIISKRGEAFISRFYH